MAFHIIMGRKNLGIFLSGLISDFDREWLCLGDWNDIISQQDNKGGYPSR